MLGPSQSSRRQAAQRRLRPVARMSGGRADGEAGHSHPSRIRICRCPASACSWENLARDGAATHEPHCRQKVGFRSAGSRRPRFLLPDKRTTWGLAEKPFPPFPINQVAQRTTATLLGVGPMVARVFRRRADAELHRGDYNSAAMAGVVSMARRRSPDPSQPAHCRRLAGSGRAASKSGEETCALLSIADDVTFARVLLLVPP
jgi:hypothetical protein